MKNIFRLLFIILIFSTLCCCEGLDSNMNLLNDRSKKTSDNIMNSIIESIEEKDTKKMLGMFSVKAKNEAQNIEEQTNSMIII